MSNRKHGRIVWRFEHTCSTSLPLTLWRIFTITIPQDHPVPQRLQWAPSWTLGSASSSLVPVTTHTSTLVCRGRTSYNSSNHELEHLVIPSLDHHKTLFTKATTSTTPHNTRMKTFDHFSW